MIRILALRNRQRTRPLALPLLRRLTRHVLEHELGVKDYELGIHFVEPEEMTRVNQQFLQHEGSTDVITFDHAGLGAPASGPARWRGATEDAGSETGRPELHGELFISVADAVKQAHEFGTTWQDEIARYLIHGLLHLRGYDDLQPAARKVMKREENRLVKVVAAKFALRQILNPKS